MKPRDLLGVLRLEDGRPWVQAATSWQRADALAVLEGRAPYNFLTRARGASKTTDLSAVALSVLLAAKDPSGATGLPPMAARERSPWTRSGASRCAPPEWRTVSMCRRAR
jgi:hypothetical protein